MKNNYSKQISCRHCHNICNMEKIGSTKESNMNFDSDYLITGEFDTFYELFKCPICSKINVIYQIWNNSTKSKDEAIHNILYSSNYTIPLGLPYNIRIKFEAIEKIKSIDVNIYAILQLRLLELVCNDKKSKGKTLALMLHDLIAKNSIDGNIVTINKAIQNFEKVEANVRIGKLSKREISIIKELTQNILEYVYSVPFMASLNETTTKITNET